MWGWARSAQPAHREDGTQIRSWNSKQISGWSVKGSEIYPSKRYGGDDNVGLRTDKGFGLWKVVIALFGRPRTEITESPKIVFSLQMILFQTLSEENMPCKRQICQNELVYR